MNTIIILVAVTVVIAVAVIALLRPAGKRRLPYERNRTFLTPAERMFYGTLRQVVSDDRLILAKVRLADLLRIPGGTKDWIVHFNRVASKHVDFVVCEAGSLQPILVIELDDSSHDAAGRQARDRFVDAVMAAAGLPILHIPPRRSYNRDALAALLRDTIASSSSSKATRT